MNGYFLPNGYTNPMFLVFYHPVLFFKLEGFLCKVVVVNDPTTVLRIKWLLH